MFPGPTELRLIGYSIESFLDPKFQIKYIDTKNQLADILTTGNFTRDKWDHLLCLFNICPFSSTVCSEALAKRVQQNSGGRKSHSEVEANDEPCCKGFLNSVIFGVRKFGAEKGNESHSPWSAKAEKKDRKERPCVDRDGLLKSGKLTLRCVTDRGQTHESQSSFSHEKTQHVIGGRGRTS